MARRAGSREESRRGRGVGRGCPETQFSIYQQIQQQFWSDMHMLKFGDVYALDVLGKNIQGWDGPWIPMLTNLQKP